ncbi:unnamed protein product [Lota lota]
MRLMKEGRVSSTLDSHHGLDPHGREYDDMYARRSVPFTAEEVQNSATRRHRLSLRGLRTPRRGEGPGPHNNFFFAFTSWDIAMGFTSRPCAPSMYPSRNKREAEIPIVEVNDRPCPIPSPSQVLDSPQCYMFHMYCGGPTPRVVGGIGDEIDDPARRRV